MYNNSSTLYTDNDVMKRIKIVNIYSFVFEIYMLMIDCSTISVVSPTSHRINETCLYFIQTFTRYYSIYKGR